MHVILTSQTAEEVSTFNVVGDLKGSEHPEQIVIVSGHLDSWDLGTGLSMTQPEWPLRWRLRS